MDLYEESTIATHFSGSSEDMLWVDFYRNGSLGNVTPSPSSGNMTVSQDQSTERLLAIIVPIVFTIVVVIGFIGNMLVIIVIISNKRMVNTTNILILSLALADLFFIVFCVPFTAAAYILPQWPFGKAWCKIMQYLTYVCAYASVYTLVLMSLDRYLAVVHPIKSISIRTERNCCIIVSLAWFIILCANIPILIQFDIKYYTYQGEERNKCVNIKGLDNVQVTVIFYVSFFVLGYVVPLSLVCILYGFMLKRLLFGMVPGNQSAESIRSKKRVTRMIIIVIILFAICWLPIQIIFMIRMAGKYTTNAFNFWLHLVANCLAYTNSCINPILYAFLSENFRKSFRNLLCCASPTLNIYEYERTQIRGSMSTHRSEAV